MNNQTGVAAGTMLKQALAGAGQVLLFSSVLSLILSLVSGVVFWMQNYNQLPFVLPFSNMAANQSAFAAAPDSGQIAIFARLVNFYNVAFPSGCRLGAGIGMIAGGFWALGRIRRANVVERFTAGVTAGALSGGRIYLMFDSKVEPFLIMSICGAVIVGTYLFLQSKTKATHELPLVKEIDSTML